MYFPGLVIGVAWSQRNLDLPQLAEDYIIGSGGEIGTVIGIKIRDIYDESKGEELGNRLTNAAVTFTVWKARYTDQSSSTGVAVIPAVEDKEWRLPGGKVNESIALKLSLQDFVSNKLVSRFETIENPRLSIPSKTLCRHYELVRLNYLKEVARRGDEVAEGRGSLGRYATKSNTRK
ncbi:hypothetical protein GGR58DRAFT_524573 [Xylaria digitata]|nr:hypothetical protein GGR58DRAFT_524573 [Xylaria digitata]